MHHSYEDWAASVQAPVQQDVLEAFSGVSIVGWSRSVGFKLRKMIKAEEANRNYEYANLLQNFLNTWEKHSITGSINRETLEILKAAAEPLAVMNWRPSSYFEGLATSLDQLIADQEQLPTGVPQDQNTGMPGGGGSSLPPMDNEFGPQDEPPPGEEIPGEEGAEGGPEGAQPPEGELPPMPKPR